jgi:hypothetical protein
MTNTKRYCYQFEIKDDRKTGHDFICVVSENMALACEYMMGDLDYHRKIVLCKLLGNAI